MIPSPRPGPVNRPRPPGKRALLPLLGALALAGCASLGPVTPPAPVAVAAAPPRPAVLVAVDPASADLAAFYARLETERRSRGLLLTAEAPSEPLPSAERLAETWVAVALRDEPLLGGAPRPAVLRRWQVPVRLSLEFGATVPPETRAADTALVAALADRLSEAARHPVSLAAPGMGGNFHVLVLSENERRGAADRLRALVPGIDDATLRLITDLPREVFCMVIAFSRDGGPAYSEAVAIIRAEHPDLTRTACYHEEIAQGLGLAADSDRARPSVFNDDQEYALLTRQDLALLRLHYDPRLRPGMSESQARPLLFSIASELVPGAS